MRAGILLDSLRLSGWRKAVLKRILSTSEMRVVLVIRQDQSHLETSAREDGVWSAVNWAERKLAKQFLHRALARVRGFAPETLDAEEADFSTSPMLADVRRAGVGDTEIIQDAELDVIIDLSYAPTDHVRADLARLGVWRLVSRSAPEDRIGPLGFWPVYTGDPLVEIAIVARRSDGDTEIGRACHCNFMWSWSMNDTLLGMKGATLIEDAVRNERPAPPQPASGMRRNLGHAPVLFARNYMRLAADATERALCEDRWRILVSRGGQAPTIIEPPAHSYWADPFAIMRGDQCHIFFEEYFYDTRRGVISHVCIDDPKPGETLRGLQATVIIDEPHHLSYPFLFEHEGALFMLPESSAGRSVDVWRATNFPHGWTKQGAVITGVSAADSSLLYWGGRWWLFTNIDRSGANDHRSELHVFHAADPIAGPWRPHALNPIVVDARCGRMAGGFLTAADGRPIRCGQVQGRKYGQEVSYRLITELTETTYAETAIENFSPIAISKGARTHHVVARDGLIVADECFMGLKRFGPARRRASASL